MHILDTVARKIDSRERLSEQDALDLFHCDDLLEIGRLADTVNREKNQDRVFFNINRHINPTNICSLSCKFCAYSRKIGEEGAYAYSIDEMVARAQEAAAQGATEVHMVGGLHPRWKFDYYKEMIAAVHQALPQVHIKAFTAVELDWLAKKARKTIREVLLELRESGLGSMPGGGAEIFHPEIRDAICDTKVSAEQWLDTHRLAHSLGMHSNCTMLYGHIERYEHRVDHMRRLRELQDETRGFNAFIPLAFQPFQNEMGIDHYTYGYDDLKTIAIARLFLDNFKHIKAYWVMLGQDIAQLALHFGANDLDGTVIEEKISRMAGGRSGMAMTRSFIEGLIHKSKRIPVERDTLYRPVNRPEEAKSRATSASILTGTDSPLTGAQFTETLARVRSSSDPEMADLLSLARQAPLHLLAQAASERAKNSATGHELDYRFKPVLEIQLKNPAENPAKSEATPPSRAELLQSIERDLNDARTKHCIPVESLLLRLPISGANAGAADHDDESELVTAQDLIQLIWSLKHTFPGLEISLSGLRGIWRLAQEEAVSVDALLTQLADAGLDEVVTDARESEADLTPGEILDLHRGVHRAGISTTAKLELGALAHGSGEPQWESFIRRAISLRGLRSDRLKAFAVEVSPGSFITSLEYLRAVSLARLLCRDSLPVVAPIMNMPSLSPVTGIGSKHFQHPVEKFAALSLRLGASDLGPIDLRHWNPKSLISQIRACGHDFALEEHENDDSLKSQAISQSLAGIRHAPSVRTTLS